MPDLKNIDSIKQFIKSFTGKVNMVSFLNIDEVANACFRGSSNCDISNLTDRSYSIVYQINFKLLLDLSDLISDVA